MLHTNNINTLHTQPVIFQEHQILSKDTILFNNHFHYSYAFNLTWIASRLKFDKPLCGGLPPSAGEVYLWMQAGCASYKLSFQDGVRVKTVSLLTGPFP